MSACAACHGAGEAEGGCLRCLGSGREPLLCGAYRCQDTAQFLVRNRPFCRACLQKLRAVVKESGLSMPDAKEIETQARKAGG